MPKQKLSQILSLLFHPLLMPVYGVLLMFGLPTYLQTVNFEFKRVILLITFLSTFVSPLLVLLLLLNLRLIKSLKLRKRKERIIPYIAVIAFYIAAYQLFLHFPSRIPPYIITYFLLAAIGVLLLLIANFWLKISAHASGLGGLIAYISFFMFKFNLDLSHFLVPAILISGAVLAARLHLNAHKPQEVYLGFLSGVLIGGLPFLFLI